MPSITKKEIGAETTIVVTGAARGIGRGIAKILGEVGATIYVTDIESRDSKCSPLPGTVEDTAELVTRSGGTGIPVRNTKPTQFWVDSMGSALFTRS